MNSAEWFSAQRAKAVKNLSLAQSRGGSASEINAIQAKIQHYDNAINALRKVGEMNV